MKTIKVIAFSTGALLGAYGLLYLIRQATLLRSTTVDVLSVQKSSGSNLLKTNLDLRLRIHNNSDIGFYVTSQYYELLIGTKKIGQASSEDHIRIRPKESADTTIHLTVNHADVLKATGMAVSVGAGKFGDITTTVKGKISGSTGKLLISQFPVKITFKLSELI